MKLPVLVTDFGNNPVIVTIFPETEATPEAPVGYLFEDDIGIVTDRDVVLITL